MNFYKNLNFPIHLASKGFKLALNKPMRSLSLVMADEWFLHDSSSNESFFHLPAQVR